MAHYDCSDCGASMGICYGSCGECTPQEVFDAKKALGKAEKAAEREWERSQANQGFDQQIKRLERERDTVKARFMESETGVLRQQYHALYNQHKP